MSKEEVLAVRVNRTDAVPAEHSSVPAPIAAVQMINQYPDIMTEAEVIKYLRIPEVSKATDFRNVIKNLVETWKLPCIHISRKRLFPLALVRQWVCEDAE